MEISNESFFRPKAFLVIVKYLNEFDLYNGVFVLADTGYFLCLSFETKSNI